jgi:endonuclease/exonuclease/phosphatase family metal-dependent hydrolase
LIKKYLLLLAPLPALLICTPAWSGSSDNTPPELDRILTGDFTDSARPPESLHIVDWNIDRGTRLDQVAKVLERDQPDLCLLQEVDLSAHRSGNVNVADELAKPLKMRYAFGLAWQELSQGDRERPSYQGQAILTRLPIRNTRVIRFQTQSGFWRPRSYVPNMPLFQRRLGGRIAIVTELDFGGRTLVVYNLHLESRSFGHIQDAQMDEILADAKHYPESTPIILAGDFNTKYNAGSLGAKLRAEGWRSALGSHAPRTHKIMFSLDWIVVRGPLRIEQGKVEHGAGGSDHLPISATVSIAGPNSTVATGSSNY